MRSLILFTTALLASTPERPPVVHRLPAISAVFPQGATPGTNLTVEVIGQHLDRASAVLSTHPSLSARIVSASPTRIQLQLNCAGNAPEGHHYLRIVSPRGASNPAVFRVGDQPHHNEQEPNSSFETAETVSVPATINARLPVDNDFDFFRFRARAGETLIFDLRAARNGSGLDAALILLDSHGRKLAHEEDTFIWDPFFSHTFEESGEFTAVIQPTSRGNDPGYVYQLDIRRAPHIQTVSPISLRPSSETEVTLYGHGLSDSNAKLRFDNPAIVGTLLQARGSNLVATIRVPHDAPPGPVKFRLVSHGLSNPAVILVDPTPLHVNGLLAPPVSINGTARYRRPERFSFRAEAGQTLIFEVRAQRYGSPVDSVVRLLDAAGKQLAVNDDATFTGAFFNKDSRLSHTFKIAGDYQVEIRNLWAVTGENFPYQLLVTPPRPSIELTAATDQPYLYPGQSMKLNISAVRVDGFSGDIPLTVQGLPAGVSTVPVSIPEGKNDAEIEFTATPGAAPGVHAAVAIAGAGVRAVRPLQVASGGGEGRHYGLTTHIVLAVAEKPLFSLECAANSLNLVRGGAAVLKVMIRREPGFDDPLTFRAANLPDGVTLETEAASADLATLHFRATPDAATGRAARISIAATAPQGQSHEAPRISLQID